MDDSLSFESFLEGAKKSAHRAMDDHGRGDYDEFALHGGVAVERLVKAVLVSKNPVYLLEMRSGSPDMLLYLGGHLEMSADKVRTVGAKDAIKRLRTLGLLPLIPSSICSSNSGTALRTHRAAIRRRPCSRHSLRPSRPCSKASASLWTTSGAAGRARCT